MVEPLLPPSRLVIETETFRTMPAVVISLAANRVWPVCESRSDTSHSAALEKERILSASACAWSLVQLISGGPQYVDPPEPRGAHPWLMALICPGWPLPSASRPTFSQRAWPPMPSQEDQKSGVRLW